MQPFFDVLALMFLPPFYFIIYGFRILETKDVPYIIEIAYKFPIQKSMKKDYLIISSLFTISMILIFYVEIPTIENQISMEKSKLQNYDCLHLYNFKSHFADIKEYKLSLLKKNCDAKTILKNI